MGYIYLFKNKVNGKCYVGQTIHLEQRLSHHIKGYRDKYGKMQIIDKAIKKYGIENFDISILEEVNDCEQLDYLEKYWIKKLNCQIPNGYNVADGGLGHRNYKQSEETKRKISLNNSRYWKYHKKSKEHIQKIAMTKKGMPSPFKGKHLTEEAKIKKSKPCICVETNIVYYGLKEASIKTQVSYCNIYRCCNGKRKTAGGYHWQYYDKEMI